MRDKITIEARVAHILYDQMLLLYSGQFLDTDEQRVHFEMKKELLERWIYDLREELESLD
ncbi:MAG TPA: hypothetical protein VMW36_05380 [Patescibacteria group bacterium]|nr:hypothetical protein [Patescibacteria group bacterium]